MKKRGALFYIIDAFVAASIIAMTITIIFATQLNTPKAEAAEDALDNYLTYLQKTSIYNAPGVARTTIIAEDLVDSPNDKVISSLAQLIQRGNFSIAQDLILDINKIALESQYGVNVTITVDDATTEIITRNIDRKNESKVFLKKNILSTYQLEPTEELYTVPITPPGTPTGILACRPDTCLYTIDTGVNPVVYDENDCARAAIGLDARCYAYNETEFHLISLEVSIWS